MQQQLTYFNQVVLLPVPNQVVLVPTPKQTASISATATCLF